MTFLNTFNMQTITLCNMLVELSSNKTEHALELDQNWAALLLRPKLNSNTDFIA